MKFVYNNQHGTMSCSVLDVIRMVHITWHRLQQLSLHYIIRNVGNCCCNGRSYCCCCDSAKILQRQNITLTQTSNSASRPLQNESHCIHAIETKKYILLSNITKNLPTTLCGCGFAILILKNRVEIAAVKHVPCCLRKPLLPTAFPM